MISHSQIYRARSALATHYYYADQADDYYTALAYVEKHLAMGRCKEGGKSRVEHTGNLIIAKFRHETARPTEGAAPDPHLHVHALLMNLAQRTDGQWVALSNEQIFQLLRVTDSIYQATLERNVRALGHAVRHEKNHIELAHITYYVSISRERQEVVVFTDDADKLPERVDRLGYKGLAHDMAGLHHSLPIWDTTEAMIQPEELGQELTLLQI